MPFTHWLRNLKSAWQFSSRSGNGRRAARSRPAPGYRPRLEGLEDRLCPSALPLAPTLTPADTATQARVGQAYGQLPLSFEANQGQTDAPVDFLSHGSGYTLFLAPAEAVLSLQKPDATGGADALRAAGDVLRMDLVGANAQAPASGLDAQAGTSNYLIGNDPTQWHTGITNYGRVEYQNVYAGVKLAYYGSQQQLEYDFTIAPGANPGLIDLAFKGAQSMNLDSQGNLVLHTAGGDVVEHAPVLYQDIGGVRQAVAGRYVLQGNGQVGFAVGDYDRSQALVIDPVLSYSTYLGGSNWDSGIAVDGAGNAYVTGWAYLSSPNYPDAFVAKLNATGTALVYSTYLGGSRGDYGYGIAVDSAGNAYVTGETGSLNLPTTSGAFQRTFNGSNYDAFVAELNATGTALVYSTYLGGPGNNQAFGIALDSAGNAYVTGNTSSVGFPTTYGLQRIYGGGHTDAFVTKLNATGTRLVYSTFLGGSGDDSGYGIVVDGAGNAYVTGSTTSTNFPTKNPLQGANGGGTDAFVTEVNATGTAMVYSTYLGGSGNDYGRGIAVDSAGNAYVTGYTASTNFPTKNALQAANGGGTDAFVTEVHSTGTALVYSTYLGGNSDDRGQGIAVDSAGNAYVTGSTTSTNFPASNPLQAAYGGGGDAFVTEVNATGAALVYSTYLGGSGYDIGYGIAVDGAGNAYVTGNTTSTDFPTNNPLQAAGRVFVAKLNLPAASSGFLLSSPFNVAAGGQFNVTVTATDATGNVATGYTGTVQLTSSDGSATLPASYTFTADDHGVHTFAVTLNTPGNQSLLVTDNNAEASNRIVVSGPATHFTLSAPAAAAGAAFGVTVTASDALGNEAISYTGTVSLTNTDPTGIVTVLGSYTFTAADQSAHVFSVTLTTAGTQSFTATDANGLIGTAPSYFLYPAAASQIVFTSHPASVSAGTPFSVTIAVTDAFGNLVTNYTGTVHFTDSKGSASLPADYTFTWSDHSVHTFTGLVLRKKGVQALKVSDLYSETTILGTISVDVV